MRKIGLIGGMSWLSTRTYYDHINKLVQARKGPRSLTPPQRGKPRYFGLILTGVLLLALALAAALSTYYSVGSAPADISAVTTDVANNAASPEAVPAAAADLPSVDEEMAADGQDSETAASAVPPPPAQT